MKQLIDIAIATITIAMEAGGESNLGKRAVAHVLVNRVKAGRSMTDVVLDPYDFSCWDTKSPTRMNLDKITDAQWYDCFSIALGAMLGKEEDPTNGAIYYLNVGVVMSTAGKLPDWWSIDGDSSTEIEIGHHTFRRPKPRVS